ncbi:MAG: nucleotidyltransferase family protein [Chlorobiales bacterium]|jgi:NDP-sugar pyrophosphorylase family protein|nr:nucleotidyltransferase family protein [Chlorobiales bacterium]
MRAMIFAAGLGTRLHPITDTKPKALVEISGIPLLEIAIKTLIKFGFQDIIINVHHFASQITGFLEEKKNFGINLTISDETDRLLDTGGGLKKASWFFSDGKPFLVYNVDILTNLDLGAFYQAHTYSNAIATLAVRKRTAARCLLFDEQDAKKLTLCGWKNSKTNEIKIARASLGEPKELAFSGIHIIDPGLFKLMSEDGKFSIIDTYLRVAQTHCIAGYLHDDSLWLDVGKPESLGKAAALLNRLDLSA